ncbi:uncharacterized protein C05D11.1-like [Chrysoperla carnea]|uniref:uncharacterized protein C05D11.1-like n=1 Tax=Chrysoperla carnea TaxID=189513 RepID=UPI001D06D8A3|nr:uncharacterized protein C05D11.1-like [Chrysoperla carnea]
MMAPTPVDGSPAQQILNNFELVYSLKAENYIPVHKYKSTRTGITVVLADVQGPTVNGYFCLATETFDDDGLPHTLEHLIFLGSEEYPYKGVLDLLANRCLARGTNAWTDVDHTCYTISTAGSEGFLSLLPIYLDHVLYPTMTDEAFVTEVHHVTGEGDDAGVVYCEMQGCENSGESRVHLELSREMYPGHCGYKSQIGGIMKNLRESTTNEKCKDFHKQYYRPDNLVVIITGPVNHLDVFKSIEIIEQKILARGPLDAFERPWQNEVPALTKSVSKEIKYPCDEETNGLVYVGWRGPSAVTQLYEMNACALLLKYLTDTSISPLQREFIEIEDPLASNIGYSLSENSISMLYIMFENVPKGKIELVEPKLLKILESFVNGTESIDMRRLHTVIHRFQLERLSHLESNPHDAMAFIIIGDFLYGRDANDFKQRLSGIEDLQRVKNEPKEFWINLIKKYLFEAPMITIKGVPSIAEQKKMVEEEMSRVQKQIKELGEDGLKTKAEALEAALSHNGREPPTEMIRSIPIPGTDTIQYHKIARYRTDGPTPCPSFELSKVPIYTHVDHVNTNFVYMFLLMDTMELDPHLRNYLPLYLEALLESPIMRGDQIIPYEEVVTQLEADTVGTSTRIGLEETSRFTCGPFSHTASLMLQLEEDKYERGITWLHEILYCTVFTVDRLKVLASKIINDVAHAKRSGNKLAKDLMKDIYYCKNSNWYSNSMLRQQTFLTSLLDQMNNGNGDAVIADVEKVRDVLTNPKNMVLHLALNLDHISQKVSDPAAAWFNLLPCNVEPVRNTLNVTPDWKLMAPIEQISKPNCIVGLGACESSFLITTTPCIKDFNDPDLAPILVFLVYITQLEGPMWRQLRGAGLTYHYRIQPVPNEALLYFVLSRATNVTEAFKVAKKIMEDHVNLNEWDENLMASAKSSLVFEIIQREQNIGDVVAQSMLSYFKGVGPEYNKNLIKLIHDVTVDDLKRVGKKYIEPLFNPEQSKTAIVCNPGMIEKVMIDLQECDLKLTSYNTIEDSFLNVC